MKSHELQVSLQTFRTALADFCKGILCSSNLQISKQSFVILREIHEDIQIVIQTIGDCVPFSRNLDKMLVIIVKVAWTYLGNIWINQS